MENTTIANSLRLLKKNKPKTSEVLDGSCRKLEVNVIVEPLENSGTCVSPAIQFRAPPPPPPDSSDAPRILTKSVSMLRWGCDTCGKECVPVRDESRCMCGHRLKEHVKPGSEESGPKLSCKNRGCRCKKFFYIIAEGSWILRCQCKHKHVEHDPVTYACAKSSCDCGNFLSPWVCNCDHPWKAHSQQVVEKEVKTLMGMMQGAESDFSDVNQWDVIKRGEKDVLV
mmetsp:Transcript_35983/g.49960  ORF Transcript_35983/g.49960 Transcript_35983/m.49960 type:complete len:226 (+) Transcript_35983:59-736(+)